MKIIHELHRTYVFERRLRVLCEHIVPLLADHARILDVGCGDGRIDHLIGQCRPDVEIQGIDVMVRPTTHVPVTEFDGRHIPFDDGSFDIVVFVDVLHNTDNPRCLLAEAKRVCREAIVIKDHCRDGLFAETTLRLMDWFGNAPRGVVLPYNFGRNRAGTRNLTLLA